MKRLLILLTSLMALTGCRDLEVIPLGDPDVWSAHPADGVRLDLSNDDGALRLDFAFSGGGYAIARREVDLDLPENYAFRFRLRGDAPVNHLEFKLIDDSGENVWWYVRRDVGWPDQWQTFTTKKRHIGFAWGPQGGGEPGHIAAIEWAVTAGSGGQGTIWIDDLELVALPVVSGPPPAPVATASSARDDQPATAAVDGDPETAWLADATDPAPALTLDLGRPREYGGLTVTWPANHRPAAFAMEVSDDGRHWRTLHAENRPAGDVSHIYLPETESSWLRLQMDGDGDSSPGVADILIRPLSWSATREAFFMNLADEARAGLYPPGFRGEPTTWTVVGIDRDTREGLIGAGGAVEVGPGEFSVEPFLWADGRLVTWADVPLYPALVGDDLPLPSVTWRHPTWRLTVTALGTGEPEASSLLVRYRLENRGARPDSTTLLLAVRPFQVNPPVQFLNVRGGTAPIERIALAERTIRIDDRPRVHLLQTPTRFGATAFSGGDVVVNELAAGRLPSTRATRDDFRAASAAAAYAINLPAGGAAEIDLLIPLHDAAPTPRPDYDPAAVTAAAEQAWRTRLDRLTITGPAAASEALASMRAQLGDILVNRAGVRIQPGARSYARSWIRDGALTGVALLRLGHADAACDFLRWYAPHQYDTGKIPCVVDGRGADPVPEHDSTGEFIYLVTECYRYTGDRALLDEMWPRVLAGVAYLESLLDERRTPEYAADDRREFYGILPPSISHEGYAAKPMHSYWDDFFALRGLKDAAWLAGIVGTPQQRAELTAARDRFAADLSASIAAAMARHDIAYVPGCADLGDFDATSTTIALDPAAAASLLPPGALTATFERYWKFFDGRRSGDPWEAFTPYEIRTIGAFVRLGRRDRAQAALDFFLDHRTPIGWRQWPEVVASDTTHARFIGDMPHTWVGSDYIRSLLDMFVYEQRAEGDRPAALVLAAGLPADWLAEGGIQVTDLRTPYGRLTYTLQRTDTGTVMDITSGLDLPSGGLLLAPPDVGAAATIDGQTADCDESGRVRLRHVPARVVWER